jgi:hypothetical protein
MHEVAIEDSRGRIQHHGELIANLLKLHQYMYPLNKVRCVFDLAKFISAFAPSIQTSETEYELQNEYPFQHHQCPLKSSLARQQ